MEIPYTVDNRPDTGLYNAKLGIWLFLASEVMLFGGLFATYIVMRVGAGEAWLSGREYHLSVPIGTINTTVLIISSVTMVMAWASLKLENIKRYKLFLGLTVLCGFTFLTIKGFEYYGKFHHHIFPSTNTFYAVYFTLTGLHGLHVLGGMIVNAYLFGRALFTLVCTVAMGGLYTAMFLPLKATATGGEGFAQGFCWFLLLALPIAIIVLAILFWCKNNTAEMIKNDPHRLANRVETSGLFWHFVDLVWIFLFPVLYLL